MTERKNKNRSYQKLRVWQDAIEFYKETCRVFRNVPYELKRIASQSIGSSDSVHRNIAEGHCRRSIREYIQFLYIALASLGESVSGFHAYLAANQISKENFEKLDSIAYKLENGLIKLIQSLQIKSKKDEWIDHLL
jgi:four helix bundle protein